jgi:hypothetical protein
MAIEGGIKWHADDVPIAIGTNNSDFYVLSLEIPWVLQATSNKFNSKPVTNLPINQYPVHQLPNTLLHIHNCNTLSTTVGVFIAHFFN